MIETLGVYKILERLGEGGIGEVYRARDTRLGRTVALKVVRPEIAADAGQRARFLRDARAATALSHPSIAALYEIGEDQEQLFLACEFVPGDTLGAAIGGRPMNPKLAIDYAVQLSDALADAHAAGAVHGDLKPHNVFVTPRGRVKIVDYGLSAWTNGGAARRRAAEEATGGAAVDVGTVAYLSPEQALGERSDHRTDIFSLGAMLFEMLTGQPPFASAEALPLKIVQAPAPAPSSLNPDVPDELDPIVQRALAKSLDHRYESTATLAAELRAVAAIVDERATAAEIEAASMPAGRGTPGAFPWRVTILVLTLAALAAGAWIERAELVRVWLSFRR
jgi:serine/threonine protein kinase